jgi:L-aminopeptidase/D-esterase-like protein
MTDHTLSSITQIPGIYAGHTTHTKAGTGCTVIVCPAGATGAVDVRGGAPATRETDLLRPEETVQTIDAVVLSGGSAFGLAASCGVAEELERRGIGVDVGVGVVPIVTEACVFDLGCGAPDVRPTAKDGIQAVQTAFDNAQRPLERGNVGAGAGCTVGKVAGSAHCMKSGLGENVQTAGGLICGAVAAVNALGDVVDPQSGTILAGTLANDGTFMNSVGFLLRSQLKPQFARSHMGPRSNTTISCIVTNARLTKAQATKVAQMSADAYAHAIRPTHTTNDGDAIFVMATGQLEVPPDVVGVLSTRALEKAIVDAVLQAKAAFGLEAACSLDKRR